MARAAQLVSWVATALRKFCRGFFLPCCAPREIIATPRLWFLFTGLLSLGRRFGAGHGAVPIHPLWREQGRNT